MEKMKEASRLRGWLCFQFRTAREALRVVMMGIGDDCRFFYRYPQGTISDDLAERVLALKRDS